MEIIKFKILSLIIIVLIFLSCTNDDESTSTLAPVSLTFNLETAEDQMGGEFNSNTMVVFNGKVWSVAGCNSYLCFSNANNEVWKSDNGINWVSVTSNIFAPRTGHSLTVFDGKMWLIGGVNNASDRLSDVWYSTDGLIWILATDTPSFGTVSAHSTVVFNDRLFLIKSDEVWSSADGINWNLEADNIFIHRFYHSAVVFNDAIYVIGGETGTDTYFNEIWKSVDGVNWSEVTTTAPIFSSRSHHTVTVYKDKVWVIAGTASTHIDSNEIWVSSDMITWQNYTGATPFGSRSSHVNLVFNDALWLFGGFGGNGSIWTIKE